MDDLYNVYNKDGYLIGNGGNTAEEAARLCRVSLDEFNEHMKNHYANNRNNINSYMVRRDRECKYFYKWTPEDKAEWDKVCKMIREGGKHGRL